MELRLSFRVRQSCCYMVVNHTDVIRIVSVRGKFGGILDPEEGMNVGPATGLELCSHEIIFNFADGMWMLEEYLLEEQTNPFLKHATSCYRVAIDDVTVL